MKKFFGIFTLIFLLQHASQTRACEPTTTIEYEAISTKPRVMFGEIHGTNESPAFFGSTVCLASKKYKHVSMVMEWPSDMVDDVHKYLRATPAEQAEMIASWRFFSFAKDGRTSMAMLKMIASLSEEINSGKVRLLFMDQPISTPSEEKLRGLPRDAYMWEIIKRDLANNPVDQMLVLVGNFHIFRSSNPDGSMRLGQLAANFTVLDMDYSAGTAWVCTDRCGIHDVKGDRHGLAGAIEIGEAGDDVDGRFSVGKISASPPALASN